MLSLIRCPRPPRSGLSGTRCRRLAYLVPSFLPRGCNCPRHGFSLICHVEPRWLQVELPHDGSEADYAVHGQVILVVFATKKAGAEQLVKLILINLLDRDSEAGLKVVSIDLHEPQPVNN